jgi:hypothetical protein
MKKIITLFLAAAAIGVQAQTKVVDHAVITTKTTVISPEGDDAPPPPPVGDAGGEVRIVRSFGGDGETKSVTTLKGDKVKTFTENEMSRTTVLRDNGKKVTTTLMEMMGNKTGFYSTDEEQEQMAKRMDSMMQTRRQGNEAFNLRSTATVSTAISYVEETKKIAGISCKKALLIATKQNGSKDTSVAWYAPDFKLQGIVSTGGASGFGAIGARVTSTGGLSDLAGFPMQYEVKMGRGRKMVVEVTKINMEKEVADKEFEIPKDFVVKPMKDMQNGNGNFQIRMDGGRRD